MHIASDSVSSRLLTGARALWVGAFLTMLSPPLVAAEIMVNINTAQGLRDAVLMANMNPDDRYFLLLNLGMIELDEFEGSGSALPPIAGDVSIVIGSIRGLPTGTDFRFAEVANGGSLTLLAVAVTDFQTSAPGGCIAVADGGRLELNQVVSGSRIERCMSGGDGGAIFANDAEVFIHNTRFADNTGARGGALAILGDTRFRIEDSEFDSNRSGQGGAIFGAGPGDVRGSRFTTNHADELGGALSLHAPGTIVLNTSFGGNSAGVFGCDINVDAPPGEAPIIVQGSQFDGPGCSNVRVEDPSAHLFWVFNTSTVEVLVRTIDSTADAALMGNVLVENMAQSGLATAAPKDLCADFNSGAFTSFGANVATDSSCALIRPDDLVTANPGILAPDAEGVIALAPNSPAIERGASGLVFLPQGNAVPALLPCGYRDVRGLGRPQDADGDGVFRCDSGAYEVQGGPDLGNAVSGAYFDLSRSGEGSFIEAIGGGVASVATFTYSPQGGLAWFVGLGFIVGNSVVVDDLSITRGGRFGAVFDPALIDTRRVGGASFVFPSCEATSQPGQWAFDADPGVDYSDFMASATRLTGTVTCSGAMSANAGRSGIFYAPERVGEGVLVQFLPDGSAIVMLYSYDAQGNQFWTVSSSVTITGDTLTASMIYAAQPTRFGLDFVANQIQFAPWGTITLTYSGCDQLTFAYNSSVAGFGSGQYAYSRLTSEQGTSCTSPPDQP